MLCFYTEHASHRKALLDICMLQTASCSSAILYYNSAAYRGSSSYVNCLLQLLALKGQHHLLSSTKALRQARGLVWFFLAPPVVPLPPHSVQVPLKNGTVHTEKHDSARPDWRKGVSVAGRTGWCLGVF